MHVLSEQRTHAYTYIQCTCIVVIVIQNGTCIRISVLDSRSINRYDNILLWLTVNSDGLIHVYTCIYIYTCCYGDHGGGTGGGRGE